MALKIRLKPEQVCRIGKSHIRNVGDKACEILIEGDEIVVRDIHDPKCLKFSQKR